MEDEFRNSDYEEEDGRVSEWEAGLPNVNDLPSLSQLLVPPELASAFSISPESHRSMIDVDRASRETISTIRNQSQQHLDKINDFDDDRGEEIVLEGEEAVDLALREGSGSDSRKLRRVDSGGSGRSGEGEVDHSTAKASKRNRLVWTPQLHKRFIEVVAHLGVKNAVPKTIMQLMNVEGLTRENVASHLQKYRLYVKRMLGSSEEGSSPSDSGGGSGGGGGGSGGGGVAYAPQMVPMPYTPVQQQMVANNSYNYNNMMMMMQSGNGFGSISQYQQHRMTSNDS